MVYLHLMSRSNNIDDVYQADAQSNNFGSFYSNFRNFTSTLKSSFSKHLLLSPENSFQEHDVTNVVSISATRQKELKLAYIFLAVYFMLVGMLLASAFFSYKKRKVLLMDHKHMKDGVESQFKPALDRNSKGKQSFMELKESNGRLQSVETSDADNSKGHVELFPKNTNNEEERLSVLANSNTAFSLNEMNDIFTNQKTTAGSAFEEVSLDSNDLHKCKIKIKSQEADKVSEYKPHNSKSNANLHCISKSVVSTDNYSISGFLGKFTSSKFKRIKHEKEVLQSSNKKNKTKIIYSISELIELKPAWLFQLFEYQYKQGSLLVTDLIFHVIAVVDDAKLDVIESMLNSIKAHLTNPDVPSSIKSLELLCFISLSFGIKSFNNPIIFMSAYGTLIETIIQSNIMAQIDDLPFLIESALVETVILYCINCWKFQSKNHQKITRALKKWEIPIYVPDEIRLFGLIVMLLSQKHRFVMLREMSIFFSINAKSHDLQTILYEAIELDTSTEVKQFFRFLVDQLQILHAKCCAESTKVKLSASLVGKATEKIKSGILTEVVVAKPRLFHVKNNNLFSRSNSLRNHLKEDGSLYDENEDDAKNVEVLANVGGKKKQSDLSLKQNVVTGNTNSLVVKPQTSFRSSYGPTNILPGSLSLSRYH